MLVSSGLIVDHPVAVSLLSFAALAVAAFMLAGARAFWLAALLGHVGSTALVYLFIGLSRAADPTAWARVVHSPDYGVSAVSAAWLGAIAAVSWRRRLTSRAGRGAIAVGCGAVGLFAYSLRPDVTILSSEHLVAFTFGILVATPEALSAAARRLARLRPRLPAGADPISIGMTGLAVGLVAVAFAPTAFGDLREQLSSAEHPSAGSCVTSWNSSRQAPRPTPRPTVGAGYVATMREVIVPRRRHPKWADYCTFAFPYPHGRLLYVKAVWREGHATRWRQSELRNAPAPAPENATLTRAGRLHLARS